MEEVKKAIKQKGLKMKFVARSLGMHPTYLSQILNGHRKPRETDRAALAGFLDIPRANIFFDESAC